MLTPVPGLILKDTGDFFWVRGNRPSYLSEFNLLLTSRILED